MQSAFQIHGVGGKMPCCVTLMREKKNFDTSHTICAFEYAQERYRLQNTGYLYVPTTLAFLAWLALRGALEHVLAEMAGKLEAPVCLIFHQEVG